MKMLQISGVFLKKKSVNFFSSAKKQYLAANKLCVIYSFVVPSYNTLKFRVKMR